MDGIKRFVSGGVVVGALLASTGGGVLGATPAYANGPTLLGAGSTWVQIALDQWRADIARQGYNINYQGVGSSAGREFYIIDQVDFAASEIPFQPDELPQLHRSFQYLPDVAGGTSLMYNLHTPAGLRITSLRLDADAAAKIFTGQMTSWQDPEIAALNPGLQIQETSILPVVRSDGSGTSAQFSLYLQDQAPGVWATLQSICPAPCSQWPTLPVGSAQNGSDGVANFVANDAVGSGSIGYVEAGFAYQRQFPVVSLHNASGNFAQPTTGNVATALRHATLHADLTQDLTGVYRAPEPNAYPMSSYSYMITQTTGFDPAKGQVLGTWLIYIACAGQQEAAPLGYSPLPPNLVQDVFDAVRRIPGAPNPPPITPQTCANPTVTGQSAGTSGSAFSHGGTPGGGGQTNASSTAAPSASASANASASASAVTSASAVGNLILNASQRQAAFAKAEETAGGQIAQPVVPLGVAGSAIVAAAFAPMLFRRWRR